MKKEILMCTVIILIAVNTFSQSIGIGTSNPRQSAVLDINSSNKGVLFPRLTYAQILDIANPANGLHIFNTDINSLQFYDSIQSKWVIYSKDITEYQVKSNLIFKLTYPLETRVIVITVYPGVYASVNLFNSNYTAHAGTKIILFNYGNIIGESGQGGRGGTHESCNTTIGGSAGQNGGAAITTANQIDLTVFNYGLIAGGGGGGGGGGYNGGQFATTNYGGGGGSGRGLQLSFTTYGVPFNQAGGDGGFQFCVQPYGPAFGGASQGNPGNITAPGTGGAGSAGNIFNTGGTGGNGSGYAQTGTVGTGALPGAGGAGGKAVSLFGGGTNYSNTIINRGGGQVIGVVD